ncbi:MAG: type II toxin-antitoxin system VapC family toxin [Acidimicrobiales bacterium]
MTVLLDTHALLWWQAGGQRLSTRAASAIARAEMVLVSPISCWEVAELVRKGRVALDRDLHLWVRDLLAQEGVAVAELAPQAAVAAGLLAGSGFSGDPADRILYATARALAVPLVTKDKAIRDFARASREVRAIW